MVIVGELHLNIMVVIFQKPAFLFTLLLFALNGIVSFSIGGLGGKMNTCKLGGFCLDLVTTFSKRFSFT